MVGKVVKAIGGTFYVSYQDNIYECKSRKKTLHAGESIIVGDDVEFELFENSMGAISGVKDRKNSMVRPKIANVDVLLILISVIPMADLSLVDKLIVNCEKEDISTCLVITKNDIVDNSFIDMIKNDYTGIVDNILSISNYSKSGLGELKEYIKNKTCGLAGQSAVGKTSLLNELTSGTKMLVGGLSQKVNRGRHTTRHNEIFKIEEGTFITDTVGFSLFTELDIRYDELMLYYPDYYAVSNKCKYSTCTHTNEPNCQVKKLVNESALPKSRYERYLFIFNELKDKYDNRFRRMLD